MGAARFGRRTPVSYTGPPRRLSPP